MVEALRRDMDCESLLDCVHGLKELDQTCFTELVTREEPLSVDELAAAVDRERSTTYRSVQRLLDAGLVDKQQVNYDDGSYYHVYTPTDPEDIATDMQRALNDWYAKMGQLIQEFEEKYADTDEQVRVKG